MNTLPLAVVLAFASGAALAASNDAAIQARNYEFRFSSQSIDTSNSLSNGVVGADFTANLPIYGWLGGSLTGAYSHSEAKVRKALESASDTGASSNESHSCSFDNTDFAGSLFLRNPSFGRVGIKYDRGHLATDCGFSSVFLATGDRSLATTNYGAYAEYYLGKFTFGAARNETELENGPKLKSNAAQVSWYPFTNLRLGATYDDLYSKSGYGLVIEHQPEFLGNSFSVSLGYSVRNQTPEVRTITFNLVYHFGTQVDLLKRDREYR